MIIIEHFTMSKSGKQSNNEDALFIGERIIAVVDGVTSKTTTKKSISAGRFASQTICDALKTLPCIYEPFEILNYLNEYIKNTVSLSAFSAEKEPPAASIMLYDSWSNRIISYGDCQLMLNNKTYKREKEFDNIMAQKRSNILNNILSSGKATVNDLSNYDVGRKAIENDLLYSFLKFANKNDKYGFPILGIGKIIPELIDTFNINQSEPIVMATDGYPILKPTLTESEAYLQKIIKEDPLLIRKYKSTKGVATNNVSYDDRTYVRFV